VRAGVVQCDQASRIPVAESGIGVIFHPMILERFPEVERLSALEKLQLASELWNQLEAHPSDLPVSDTIVSELERRMEHFKNHPAEHSTWAMIKERVQECESC
jgi:putative addiction module component (TIGR02574 family)